MDPVKRFLKETATYTIFDFLRRFIGFLLIPIYTRALTPEQYGILFIVNLVLGFLMIFYNLGLGASLYKYQPKDQNAFVSGIFFMIPYTAILSLILIYFSQDFARFFLHKQSLSHLFQIGFIFLFFEGILNQVLALTNIERHPSRFGFLSLLRFTSGLLLNILFVVYLKRGVAGVLSGNCIAAIGVGLVALGIARSHFTFKFDASLLKEQFRYAIPLLPAITGFFLIDYIDRFMLERMAGFTTVGVYSLGYQFGTVVNLAVLGYRSAYAPFFFHLKEEEHSEMGRAFRYFMLGIGFVYVLLIMLLPDAFRLFVGRRFWTAQHLVWILALGFVAHGIYINFASHLYIKNRTHIVSILVTICLGVNILGNSLLIPPLKGYGAAWATLFAYAILVILTYLVTRPEDYDPIVFLKVFFYILAVTLINLLHPSLIIRLVLIFGYGILLII